jgi:predicted SAM-dependent methyltransferase
MKSKLKINFGCGKDIRKDYINVDMVKFPKVDKIVDLNKRPYPFKTNSSDEIFCSSVLQYVDNPEAVISEFYRILKKGGKLHFDVPHLDTKNVWKDVNSKRGYAYTSFDRFVNNRLYFPGVKVEFRRMKKRLIFGKKYAIWNYLIEPIANKFHNLYEDTPLRVFPAMKLEVIMIK